MWSNYDENNKSIIACLLRQQSAGSPITGGIAGRWLYDYQFVIFAVMLHADLTATLTPAISFWFSRPLPAERLHTLWHRALSQRIEIAQSHVLHTLNQVVYCKETCQGHRKKSQNNLHWWHLPTCMSWPRWLRVRSSMMATIVILIL